MSITGEPQIFYTVKSSWEILDSPVPLKSKCSELSAKQNFNSFPPITNTTTPAGIDSKASLPLSNTFTSLRSERTQDSVEPFEIITAKSIHPQEDHKASTNSTDTLEISPVLSDDKGAKRMNTDKQNNSGTLEAAHRVGQSRGTATYVSSQRRPTEDIAETIATEFEQHVKRSQRVSQSEKSVEHTAGFQYPQNKAIAEETESADLYRFDQEKSIVSSRSYSNIELNAEEVYEENISDSNITIRKSSISEVSNNERYPVVTHSQNSTATQVSEVSNMYQPPGQRHYQSNPSATERGHYRHPPPENARQIRMHNRNVQNRRRNRVTEDQHPRPLSNDSNFSRDQQSHPRSPETQVPDSESLHHETEDQHTQPSRADSLSDTGRSRPDGVDHPNVPIVTGTREQEPQTLTGQIMPLPAIPPPNFHPPPTIIQNGISQADLLELMSKGLGQFTTEMTVMVIEKLKPEYETFAKQVGAEVKESTVTELKDLREKLTTAEKEVEALKLERDSLKVENSKERDQMKKEFEKDRLKRVKEFEEKKELIDNLQKENEQFKGLLKEKDKMLRKAEMKAKSEEQKRVKSEEDHEKKLKDMQKDLDKAKGELLVQKSKKRLQVSSAQSKKECLGKLNSQYSRQFNGHKPIPYDEGDD